MRAREHIDRKKRTEKEDILWLNFAAFPFSSTYCKWKTVLGKLVTNNSRKEPNLPYSRGDDESLSRFCTEASLVVLREAGKS